ncbi:unnamed protein product [Orchesella dallaii]|uniref:Methyl farnesoate epoxidase n=1 Tax=Orchesella dallaii TaxID=48710 RepID=A0ABP1RDJ5_9HEXA
MSDLLIFLQGFVLALILILVSVNYTRRPKNLAPGPFPLPILGNLVQLGWINATKPHVAFAKLGEKYGDVMSIQLGSVYAVVLNSYEVMEEYLPKPEFSHRFFNGWISERTLSKRLGVVFAESPSPWQELRRFSLRSLREFGFGKKNGMHAIIHAEIEEIISDLKSKIGENNGIITFDEYFSISTLNLVWSMLAGTRYEHSNPKLLKLTNVVKEFFLSTNTGNNVLLAFPEWRNWFPNWTGMTAQRNCHHKTNSFFQEIIDERRELGIYKTNPENLIDQFLFEIDAEAKKGGSENAPIFSEDQLVGLMNDMFMAGSETSSNTLAWSLLYLIRNPEMQEKLQKEIEVVVPHGTFPTAEHETQLHYARAILAETHRISSVLPLMAPRAVVEDTYCRKFLVPKGTYVMANIYNIHHDKIYWKDPENFRPERFIDNEGHFKSDPRVKPFGFGKRNCLGEPLASTSLLHYLVVLMQNFTFRGVPNEPLPTDVPVDGITIAPQVYRALLECRA